MGGVASMTRSVVGIGVAVVLLAWEALAVPRVATALRQNPPVAFTVAPEAGSWRWRYTLRNQGQGPVEVVADRRLISLEFPAPQVTAGRRRAPRAPRCAHDARPMINEFAPRVTLAPGASYSEVFDLRDTCGMRVPAWAPGAQVTVRYGWPDARALSLSRSLLLDEGPDAVPVLQTVVSMTDAPGEGVDAPGDALLRLRVTGSQAARGEGLRVTVRVENPSVQPTWTLYRHAMFSFEVVRPDGALVSCRGLTREPAPQRDFFLRLGARGARSATLVPSAWCPTGTFNLSGLYAIRAVFESRADGEAFNLQRVFTGRVSSGPTVLRVTRGNGRYQAWEPRRDP